LSFIIFTKAWGIYANFVDIDGNEFLFTGMKSTGVTAVRVVLFVQNNTGQHLMPNVKKEDKGILGLSM
jgi:hypothetical protein